jgi:UPF0755 protein
MEAENSSLLVKQEPPRRSWWRTILLTLFFLTLVGGGIAAWFLYPYYLERKTNINEKVRGKIIHIPTTVSSLEALAANLREQSVIIDESSFLSVAKAAAQPVVIGSYRIAKDMSNNRDLLRALKPTKRVAELILHNIRTKEQLAGVLAKRVEADSASIITLFNEPVFLKKYDFTPEMVMAAFIPNTYEIYWAGTAQQVWERMLAEHKKFWTSDRLNKAKALNMTPNEVYTLASIVETESQYAPERPRIAGVYLNRLRQGWKLEADPTVVFAVGDFEIRRVLRSHLATESPYNTYLNLGLPPGPIYMASVSSIDAVLNYEQHEYMFFCARPDGSGGHAFAKTLSAHNANARAYHAWLNSR